MYTVAYCQCSIHKTTTATAFDDTVAQKKVEHVLYFVYRYLLNHGFFVCADRETGTTKNKQVILFAIVDIKHCLMMPFVTLDKHAYV